MPHEHYFPGRPQSLRNRAGLVSGVLFVVMGIGAAYAQTVPAASSDSRAALHREHRIDRLMNRRDHITDRIRHLTERLQHLRALRVRISERIAQIR